MKWIRKIYQYVNYWRSKMKSYAIIGTGAVGGYFGGKLAQHGHDVRFLARSDYNQILEQGLKVDSPKGDFHLKKVKVFRNSADIPETDILLVTLKTTENKGLKEILTPLVHENTVIVNLQNGLGMEEEIKSWFPGNPVLGCICYIGSRKVGPGHIEHQDAGHINMGCLDNTHAALRDKIALDFVESDISVTVTEDLKKARWKKLLWNIPYNGLSVVLNTDTEVIMKTPSSRRIIRMLMEDVVFGAKACGVELESDAIDKMMAFTDKLVAYEPSMKLDYKYGRPMELEYMYEKPLEAARAAGIEMVSVWMLYQQLLFIEASKKT